MFERRRLDERLRHDPPIVAWSPEYGYSPFVERSVGRQTPLR
jgi:hypothetical protein